MKRSVRRLAAVIFLLVLLPGCSSLIFQPMAQQVIDPREHGIETRDIDFSAADGTRLHAWFLPAQAEKPKGTILFLHGNAENISTHIGSVYWLPKYGYNVFLFDYRGYGLSEGEPTLEGIQMDFRAALEKVFSMPEVDPGRVAVLGQSMGAVTAITGLADSPYRLRLKALIVEGAMTSYRDVAREKLSGFWLTWPFQWPLSLTISDDYRPIDVITRISPLPLLIIHSRDDEVIPVHHALELYDAAREPKQLWLLDNVRHIAAFAFEKNRERLVQYLEKVMK
jgi:fermentation-respiration switch protein FrsA (DUF1100 family)